MEDFLSAPAMACLSGARYNRYDNNRKGARPMDQTERRRFLIRYLLAERDEDANYPLPPDADGQKRLLRALIDRKSVV